MQFQCTSSTPNTNKKFKLPNQLPVGITTAHFQQTLSYTEEEMQQPKRSINRRCESRRCIEAYLDEFCTATSNNTENFQNRHSANQLGYRVMIYICTKRVKDYKQYYWWNWHTGKILTRWRKELCIMHLNKHSSSQNSKSFWKVGTFASLVNVRNILAFLSEVCFSSSSYNSSENKRILNVHKTLIIKNEFA